MGFLELPGRVQALEFVGNDHLLATADDGYYYVYSWDGVIWKLTSSFSSAFTVYGPARHGDDSYPLNNLLVAALDASFVAVGAQNDSDHASFGELEFWSATETVGEVSSGVDDTVSGVAMAQDGSYMAFAAGKDPGATGSLGAPVMFRKRTGVGTYSSIGTINIDADATNNDIVANKDATKFVQALEFDSTTGDDQVVVYSRTGDTVTAAATFNSTHIPQSGDGRVLALAFGDDAGPMPLSKSEIVAQDAFVYHSLPISGFTTDSDEVEGELEIPVFCYKQDTLACHDTLTMDVIHVVRDRFRLTDTTSSNVNAIISIAERATFRDALVVARDLLLTEGITFADSVTLKRTIVQRIVEALVASSSVTSRLEAVSLLSIALALNESATAAFALDIVEAMNVDDALSAKWIAYATAIEAAVFADTATAARTAVLTITDRAQFADSAAATASLTALLTDGVAFNGVLVFDGMAFDAWAVNAVTSAPSRYTGFSFDSMCRLGDRYYGASSDGLYLLDGTDDDGEEIAASILTGEIDFGSPNLKRMRPEVHIGVTTDGDVVMKVTTTYRDDAGQSVKREDWYRAVKPAGVATEQRLKVGMGLKSQYWQFEILNTQGKELDLDKINLRPIELSRRV